MFGRSYEWLRTLNSGWAVWEFNDSQTGGERPCDRVVAGPDLRESHPLWAYVLFHPLQFFQHKRKNVLPQQIFASQNLLKEIKIIKTPLNSLIPTGYVVTARV